MKERELSQHLTCNACDKPVTHTGLPLFWKAKVERFGIDLNAVKRQQALGMLIGSNALASVMGPDEDMATPVMEPIEVTLCEDCALKMPIAMAMECRN